MIPKIIWQTYKDPFDQLPQYAKDAAQTWKDLNPEYKYMYMSDEECRFFIEHEFGNEWLELFDNCPLGVMRGDIWRYLIISVYGGVYVDLDTVCTQPINSWMKEDFDLVLCLDDDMSKFAQYAFAGSPGSKIMSHVVSDLFIKLKNVDYKDYNFVHKTTGNYFWTESIKQYVGLQDIIPTKMKWPDPILDDMESRGIYCYRDWKYFHEGGSIKHLVAHQNWNTQGYVQWMKSLDELIADSLDNNRYL